MQLSKDSLQLARFDEALAYQRMAAGISPHDAKVQLAVAQSARSLWFFRDTQMLQEEADAAFARAAALSPHWSVPHFEHARMYAFKEQYDRALALLGPALNLDPNNAGYWLERARYLEAHNQPKQASEAYGRCWAIDAVRECESALNRLRSQP
ncbi:hypothetical protein GCM10010841_01050 [Deinococcus aerophilus]|uniref:Tetratricopeptide repeat protein n=1 Tax=Deinococcus aerophilus TaxID=522488 RepID=A0ABQ2GH97_9DEIO|nr:hypothetical protein GCM10010841_01050 [Deinococcus aerophilus]